MTEQASEMATLLEEIAAVFNAAEQGDQEEIIEHRATMVSMYAQAMVDFHFIEEDLDWLNDILSAVEQDEIVRCRQLLEQGTDNQMIFLGSQFAAIMAGCYHHDECMTVVQAVGLKALLDEMEREQTED